MKQFLLLLLTTLSVSAEAFYDDFNDMDTAQSSLESNKAQTPETSSIPVRVKTDDSQIPIRLSQIKNPVFEQMQIGIGLTAADFLLFSNQAELKPLIEWLSELSLSTPEFLKDAFPGREFTSLKAFLSAFDSQEATGNSNRKLIRSLGQMTREFVKKLQMDHSLVGTRIKDRVQRIHSIGNRPGIWNILGFNPPKEDLSHFLASSVPLFFCHVLPELQSVYLFFEFASNKGVQSGLRTLYLRGVNSQSKILSDLSKPTQTLLIELAQSGGYRRSLLLKLYKHLKIYLSLTSEVRATLNEMEELLVSLSQNLEPPVLAQAPRLHPHLQTLLNDRLKGPLMTTLLHCLPKEEHQRISGQLERRGQLQIIQDQVIPVKAVRDIFAKIGEQELLELGKVPSFKEWEVIFPEAYHEASQRVFLAYMEFAAKLYFEEMPDHTREVMRESFRENTQISTFLKADQQSLNLKPGAIDLIRKKFPGAADRTFRNQYHELGRALVRSLELFHTLYLDRRILGLEIPITRKKELHRKLSRPLHLSSTVHFLNEVQLKELVKITESFEYVRLERTPRGFYFTNSAQEDAYRNSWESERDLLWQKLGSLMLKSLKEKASSLSEFSTEQLKRFLISSKILVFHSTVLEISQRHSKRLKSQGALGWRKLAGACKEALELISTLRQIQGTP